MPAVVTCMSLNPCRPARGAARSCGELPPFFAHEMMSGFNELVERRRVGRLVDVHCVGHISRVVFISGAESVPSRLRAADEHPRDSRDSSVSVRRQRVADPGWRFVR